MNKLAFLAVPIALAALVTACDGSAYAQVNGTPTPKPVATVEFGTKFPQPRVVGPPPPMADIWTFDDSGPGACTNPANGSINAVQLVLLSQPDVNGVPQPPKRIATFPVTANAEQAAVILGETQYRDLMVAWSAALHKIAQAQPENPEPRP